MEVKRAQFSIFDIGLFLFLFISFNVILYPFYLDNDINSKIDSDQITKILLSLSKNSTFRTNAFSEDLSNSNIVEDWGGINSYISQHFTSYSLILSNGSIEKKIFSCNSENLQIFSSIILLENSSSSYDNREIIMGVCQ